LARELSTLAVAVGETRTLEVPAAAFEAALIENFSLLRNTLRVLGTGVLATRGNLPVDPGVPREIDEGQYYPQPLSLGRDLDLPPAEPIRAHESGRASRFARYMIEVRYPAASCSGRSETPRLTRCTSTQVGSAAPARTARTSRSGAASRSA